jgi:nucleotide-binding universal stress UspA family protein
MRSYMVVIDDSREAGIALRYAARRAARTGGDVLVLTIVAPQEFVQWGAVQAAMEEEARLRAEATGLEAVQAVAEHEPGVEARVLVRKGEAVKAIAEALDEQEKVAVLVLGAPAEGAPGPLIAYFTGTAGSLPCPLVIVPAGLSDEALDR